MPANNEVGEKALFLTIECIERAHLADGVEHVEQSHIAWRTLQFGHVQSSPYHAKRRIIIGDSKEGVRIAANNIEVTITRQRFANDGALGWRLYTAPDSLDTRLYYAARLRLVSRCAARASSGLRKPFFSISHSALERAATLSPRMTPYTTALCRTVNPTSTALAVGVVQVARTAQSPDVGSGRSVK